MQIRKSGCPKARIQKPSSTRKTKYILEVSKDNGIAKRKYWTVYLVMSRQD